MDDLSSVQPVLSKETGTATETAAAATVSSHSTSQDGSDSEPS